MQAQLRLILEAEAAARRDLESAREESADLAGRAVDETRRVVREACEARDAIAREAEKRLVADAERRAAEITAETRARIAEMRARAAQRIERAAAEIVRAVLAGGGDAR